MIQEILNNIKWSEPKIVYLNSGESKSVQEAPATDDFWTLWKIHKDKLKSRGISVSKYTGTWKVTKWSDIEVKPIQTKIKEIKFSNPILYDYQNEHCKILLSGLSEHNAVLDASDTGTGKTFCALAIAEHLNLFPIVVTPKSVIPSWKKVAKLIGTDLFVSNYEQFRLNKTPYLLGYDETKNEKTEKKFKWNHCKNSIIIFDEVHRCKNHTTQNSKMLEAAKTSEVKVLCLSATIADNPMQMFALGLTLNIFSSKSGFWQWAFKRGVYKGWFGYDFKNTPENLKKIHDDIFPHRGHRIAIKDLGDKFPDNLILTETYDMNSAGNKIQAIYDNMKSELFHLSQTKKEDGSSVLTEILRARQEIELLKIPTFVEMAEDHVEEGMSVVVFVNFEESVQALSERLKTKCLVTGKVKDEERENNISDFQKGKERIIICNIRAGGVGVSLHDEFGNYPRVSLISPTWSAQDLKQALGRIHRAGSHSKAIQKIIFAAGTVEEDVAARVEKKLNNITMINDGDLQ